MLLEKHKSDIKSTWKELNNVINKGVTETCFPKEFIHNNTVISEKLEIANKFNEFFVNVGPNLAKNIEVCDRSIDIFNYLQKRNSTSMFLKSVSEEEVIKVVNSFKGKTSTGYDNIDMSILKKSYKLYCSTIIKNF